MTKYEKLEAKYNLLSTPEQQWAWVLAHKDEVKLLLFRYSTALIFKKAPINNKAFNNIEYTFLIEPLGNGVKSVITLLSVLGIESEEV